MTIRLCLLLGALALTGCASAELSSVRTDLARQAPQAQIESGSSFSFGPLSLGFARLVTRLAGVDSEEANIVLNGVRRVSVAHYKVSGEMRPEDLRMPAHLRRHVDRRGWEHLATVRSSDEVVWVLYRARRGKITDVFVTVLAEDQLILTRVSGDLSGIMRDLLEGPMRGEGLPNLTQALSIGGD